MPDWKRYIQKHLPPLHIKPEREAEIVEELAAQLDQVYQEALRNGEPPDAAEQIACKQFPNWQALARSIEISERDANRLPPPLLQRLTRGIPSDFRHALRVIRKSPSFALIAVATLALGIGGCVTIFSLIDAVILRPIDYRQPDQLVMVWESNVKHGGGKNVVSMANFLDWKARNHVFSDLSVVENQIWNVTGRGEPEEAKGISVNPEFLPMVGVRPLLGRSFTMDEGRAGGGDVCLISHRMWVQLFGAEASAVGQTILLDGTPRTVIGVLPANFPWLGTPLDVLTPVQYPVRDWHHKAGRWMLVMGRLKPGVTFKQAGAEMSAIGRQLEQEYPDFNTNWGVALEPLSARFAGGSGTALWILMASVGLVLLIACSNVANLQLARSAVREREVALRAAVGATTLRLVRLLMIENLVLALGGGILGCASAYGAIHLIKLYGPQDLARLQSAGFSAPVAWFAVGASVLTGVLFGLAPAFASLRLNLMESLKEGGRGAIRSSGGNRTRGAFVIAQVALALVLLTGASLLLRSLMNLAAVPTGFDSHNVLTATISVSGKVDGARLIATYDQMIAGMRSLPGVESASFITWLPFTGLGAATGFTVVGGQAFPPSQEPVVDVRVVQPGYFETMRIPLLKGRLFRNEDNRMGQPLRFVVNETLVREAFGRSDPLGKRLMVQMGMGDDTNKDPSGEIIGVVGDTKHLSLDGDIRAMVYYAESGLPLSFGTFVVRTSGDPKQLASAVTAAIREVRKDQPVSDTLTMDERIAGSIAQQRFRTALLGAFALIAVLLAVIGVYGVMSYAVEQRTHEIGVRLAIGAEPAAVKRWMTIQGMRLAGIGLVLGSIAAAGATRVLKSLLYKVSPDDPLSFVLTALLLALVCLAASYIPARRATRVDPLIALRWE
jgi:putative ABC transport system permease protein